MMGRWASVRDDGLRLPDALWAEVELLLPDRWAMDAIFFVLCTCCQ